MSSWSTDGADALTPCGHCDNCTRPPEEVQKKDVTLETWQLLKITDYATQDGANLTLKMLASLARGSGGGGYEVLRGGNGRGGKGKEREKVNIDLNAIAGGPVNLTQEVCGIFIFLVFSIQVFSFLFWKGNRISTGGYARTEVPTGELPPDGVPDAGIFGPWTAGAEVDPFDARGAGGDEGGESVGGGMYVPEACRAKEGEFEGGVFQSGSTGWCWREDEETAWE